MNKRGFIGGHIIRVGPLVRNKVGDDPEIAVKPAVFNILLTSRSCSWIFPSALYTE